MMNELKNWAEFINSLPITNVLLFCLGMGLIKISVQIARLHRTLDTLYVQSTPRAWKE